MANLKKLDVKEKAITPIKRRARACYGEDTGIENDKCTQTKISGAIKKLFDENDHLLRPTKVGIVDKEGDEVDEHYDGRASELRGFG